jgi:hypothetical protein
MTTALSASMEPFSDFMQTPTGRVEVEKRFPKFTLLIYPLPGSRNDFTFSKIDFKTEYTRKNT